MAFNKVLASLSVVLGSDTKRFEKGMKQSQSELQQFASKAKKMAGIATAAFTAVTTAALVAASKAAEYADMIDKSAISTGLSREQMQKFSYVADQAGVNFESLATSVEKLYLKMSYASKGNKQQIEAFESLGVSIYDANGQFKNMEVMFPEVISALNNMQNETERNAIAMTLMEETAGKIIPRLAELGDTGITDLMTKMEDLNMVMSDESVAALVKYKDGMSTVGQQFGALSRNFVAPFVNLMNDSVIPSMSRAIRRMTEFTDQSVINIQREKVELNTLVGAITGANTTQESRARLIKELNEKYPDFLKNLKDEAIDNGSIAERLREVNVLYDQKIRLAIQEQIYRRNSGKIADLMWDETEMLKKIVELEEERRTASKLSEKGTGMMTEYGVLTSEIEKLTRKLEKNREKQEELENQIIDTVQRISEQTDAVSELSAELDYGVGTEPTVTPTKTINYNAKMGPVDLSGQSIPDPLANVNFDKLEYFPVVLDKNMAKVIEFSQTVQSAFIDMAYGVGESIGNIIAGQADFGDFFGNIKEGFGKFAQDMGKLIIAYGFSMVGFQQAFANPYAAIAAGTALVAIGTAVRSASRSPDVGGGGASAAASSYQSGYSGQRQEQTIKLVWERAGKDLVAIINTENNAYNTLVGT